MAAFQAARLSRAPCLNNAVAIGTKWVYCSFNWPRFTLKAYSQLLQSIFLLTGGRAATGVQMEHVETTQQMPTWKLSR